MEWLLELAKQHGPWVAAVAFFIWQGWIRENRLAKTVDDLNSFIRGEMRTTIEHNTAAFNAMRQTFDTDGCPAKKAMEQVEA